MQAVIKGRRLTLRKWRLSDADDVRKYCGDRQLSKWIGVMPHPYKKKDAVWFIKDGWKKWRKKTDYLFAVVWEGGVVGSIGLHIRDKRKAELGYWIGHPFWGRGIASEAARMLAGGGVQRVKTA